jgi:hypothetical protein
MSGFSNRGAGERKIYANIFKGKFTLQAKGPGKDEHGTEAVMRTNKNNAEVWEYHYGSLSGELESIKAEKNDTLKAWQYILSVRIIAGPLVTINVSADSRYGDSLAQRINNLKIGPITLNPYDFTDKEGKKSTGISILQDGAKVAASITTENPQGRPQTDPKVRLDEDEYKAHSILVRKFYRELVIKWGESNNPKEAASASVPSNVVEDPLAEFEQTDADDLPF